MHVFYVGRRNCDIKKNIVYNASSIHTNVEKKYKDIHISWYLMNFEIIIMYLVENN